MPIHDRYRHTLVLKANTPTGTLDDYGHPDTSETTLGTVAGLVQPRRGREANDVSQGGAALGDHVGYMDVFAGLTTEHWVEVSGERYDITFVPDAAGLGHHYELGLKKVS